MAESWGRLSVNEVTALDHARTGKSNKAIADAMGLSISAISRVLSAAVAKLNCTLAELIQLAPTDVLACEDLYVGDTQLRTFSRPIVADWQRVLSQAERDIVAAALRGESNQQIADARRRSVRTVANQMASVFEKLGVRSRRELERLAAG
jgi:DNA-binding NarL/FixJ family response regulator